MGYTKRSLEPGSLRTQRALEFPRRPLLGSSVNRARLPLLRAIVRHLPFAPTAHLTRLLRCPLQGRSRRTTGSEPRSLLLLTSTLWEPRSEACARIGPPSAPVLILGIGRRARSYQHQAPILFFARSSPPSLASSKHPWSARSKGAVNARGARPRLLRDGLPTLLLRGWPDGPPRTRRRLA